MRADVTLAPPWVWSGFVADVLDQNEVDALLSAAAVGGIDSAAEHPLDRGLHTKKEVHAYDFKRPERVSKEQMRSLEGIHDSFARNFGAMLSGYLRTIVEVRVASIEQLTYSEFIHSLPNPTNFNLLTVEPLDGQVCLELSPLIVYPILDRLLGGNNSEMYIPQRPLTLIELRLIGRITDRAMEGLSEVWSEMVDVEFKVAETESNPHLVQIVAPNEVAVVIGLEIKMGGRAGTMSLCIPFTVIEPVMNKLVSQGWLAYQRRATSEEKSGELAQSIGATRVNVTAYVAETTISLGELLNLRVGDIIQTTKPATADAIIQIQGENKFAGTIGQHKGRFAIKVTRRAEVEESL